MRCGPEVKTVQDCELSDERMITVEMRLVVSSLVLHSTSLVVTSAYICEQQRTIPLRCVLLLDSHTVVVLHQLGKSVILLK